jgi:two-component system, OmpR family, sensor histidine kinase KdpD
VNGRLTTLARPLLSAALVLAVTAVYHWVVPANPTTVALTYVVVVLLIASNWGVVEATTASVVATACFNVFFLPPVYAITVADPENWVALVAFLLTGIVASQLSGRARRRTAEALARQQELEQLYALSRALLLSPGRPTMASAIAAHIAESFAFPRVAVFDQRADALAWATSGDPLPIDSALHDVARRGVSIEQAGLLIVAIQLGGTPVGALAIPAGGLSDTVVQSIANLAAIGLERARALEATARAEASQESGQLRATMLDALAHEFKTPLTSMKVAAADLRGSVSSERDRELASIIDEDLDRLQSLVSDTVATIRIDAGDFTLRPHRYRVSDLVAATVRQFEARLGGRQVVVSVPESLEMCADRELLGLALRQLLDNAVKYSPPRSAIEIAARPGALIEIAVRNSGAPIPDREQARLFERFFRGSQARRLPGTGMGLAIVRQIAEAHKGSVRVRSGPDTGTELVMALPPDGGVT